MDAPVEPFEESAAWRSAKTDKERHEAAAEWVRKGQQQTGFEHAVVLTTTRVLWSGTSDERYRVYVPWSSISRNGEKITAHHSHRNLNSLSHSDFRYVWREGPVGEIVAHSPDQGIYSGRPSKDPQIWSKAWKEAFIGAASELRVLSRRYKRPLAYLAEHLVNGEVDGRGLAWYEYELPARAIEDFEEIKNDLDGIRRFIAAEFDADV